MSLSNVARGKPDAVAIASKGKVTSQIVTQSSDDRPTILSTWEEN